MSANRTTSMGRASYDDKSETRRQDSFSSSESTLKGKDDSSASNSSSWFKRSRASSEGVTKASSSRNVNLYTHCGRHTNQYLFGGHSISDSIKDLWKKKD
ncbi:hypothetical protein NUW58_g4495 [Xylaria curta]|uniref:Uncharacterized protein n=1 Tax=Xylaria curta TaxID=42375 RepID=A0ACC1P7F1_9PEZI|nr:hypothetical protein NUW58_g4495 [Xylaria curta]